VLGIQPPYLFRCVLGGGHFQVAEMAS
jgi:hypothetical protein